MSDATELPPGQPKPKPTSPPAATIFSLEQVVRRQSMSRHANEIPATPPVVLPVAQELHIPTATVQSPMKTELPPGFAENIFVPSAAGQPGAENIDVHGEIAPAKPARRGAFSFSDKTTPLREAGTPEPAAVVEKPNALLTLLRRALSKKGATTAKPNATDSGIQRNYAPGVLVLAVLCVFALLSWSFVRQSRADDVVQQAAAEAQRAAQATAATLGSSFNLTSGAQGMPLQSTTPADLTMTLPSRMPPGDDARALAMLAMVEGNGAGVVDPKVITQNAVPAVATKNAGRNTPTERPVPHAIDLPKKVPTYLEGEIIEEVEVAKPRVIETISFNADVTRASVSIPYRMISTSVDAEVKQALVLDILTKTAAWLREGDELEGGYTIVGIYRSSVVVRDMNRRLSALRLNTP
jgi:type II secretory pathway pseudopilin PulG